MNEGLEHRDDLIAKVLAGEASRAEVDLLEGWMNDAPENRLYFEETKKIFARIEGFKVEHNVDTVKAWEKLNARIAQEEDTSSGAKVIPLFSRPVWRAAASVALLAVLTLLINYLFNNSQPVPVVVAAQQQVTEQKLPDGSKVTLNKNSELAYVVSDRHVREVKLKGEAYFEVVHNEELPFEITIDEVIIKDIGTAFNVKALPGSATVEVFVESGEVHFYTTSNEGLSLVKGEKAVYTKSTKQFSKSVAGTAENTLSYKSRIFLFKGTPLREVIRQLNNVYGSKITLADERLGNCLLSTSFNEAGIETVLDIITETLDLEMTRAGDKIVLKGQPCTK